MVPPGICKCSDKPGRNLVVCIDGAYTRPGEYVSPLSGQTSWVSFILQSTHVSDLFSKCAKTEHSKQLMYYSDGINVDVRSSQISLRVIMAMFGW